MEENYTVKQVNDRVWNIDDEDGNSAYLILGSEKAVLIDTTMGKGEIAGVIRKITNLPTEVALTHGHWDHACHAHEFQVIYIHPGDYEALKRVWSSNKIVYTGKIVPILENDVIDLGNRKLRVWQLPGHTPGSVIFMDDEGADLFSGDAFGSGSGVLMALGSTPACLSSYQKELERFQQHISGRRFQMYGGHRYQENGIPGLQDFSNPLSEDVLKDMIVLCEKIIKNDPELEWRLQEENRIPWKKYYISRGKAAMWVTKEQAY